MFSVGCSSGFSCFSEKKVDVKITDFDKKLTSWGVHWKLMPCCYFWLLIIICSRPHVCIWHLFLNGCIFLLITIAVAHVHLCRSCFACWFRFGFRLKHLNLFLQAFVLSRFIGLVASYFMFFLTLFFFVVATSVVSNSAIHCSWRLVSEMTCIYHTSDGTLNLLICSLNLAERQSTVIWATSSLPPESFVGVRKRFGKSLAFQIVGMYSVKRRSCHFDLCRNLQTVIQLWCYDIMLRIIAFFVMMYYVDVCIELWQRVRGCHNSSYRPMCQRHFRNHRCMFKRTGQPAVESQWWATER